MRSLVRKDLYNISHNAKSMFFILLVFSVVIIPFYGAQSYIFVCAILCSMMIVTTFSFDTNSDWNRYAMIMPVTKRDLVAGKFIALLIFCGVGAVFGLVVGAIGGIFTGKLIVTMEAILQLLFYSLAAWTISMVFGGISIPLVFKFGAEKGRMLLLVSFLVPAGICIGIYQLLSLFGVVMGDRFIFLLICISPVIAFLWSILMYKISCMIFEKQEL